MRTVRIKTTIDDQASASGDTSVKPAGRIFLSGFLISALLLCASPSQSGKISKAQAEAFIRSLVYESDDLKSHIDPSQLQLSERLGIRYEGVKNKFLISYDIESDVREKVIKGKLSYEIEIDELAGGFSRLRFVVPSMNYQREFYFESDKLISPISYYTRKWKHIESTHFHFVISDTTYWNSHCVDNLERFYGKSEELLAFTQEQRKRVKAEKIYYIFCKDEEEIKLLAGFPARGMYNLAYDCIITTFSAHYHELLHLLINYKLERLPPHTHPFLQEGFAVALGGRGGKEPRVILDLGVFLYEAQILDYRDILSTEGFYRYDTSLNYPVSGLYNRFMIEEVGIERYLELYRKYSGLNAESYRQVVSKGDLPGVEDWNRYLHEFKRNKAISLGGQFPDTSRIYGDPASEIHEHCDRYYFRMMNALLIPVEGAPEGYHSRKFDEYFQDGSRRYNGEKYLITANENEISIYNLYTNNLIAHYAVGFSYPPGDIPVADGFYVFSAPKDLFDEELTEIFTKAKH